MEAGVGAGRGGGGGGRDKDGRVGRDGQGWKGLFSVTKPQMATIVHERLHGK